MGGLLWRDLSQLRATVCGILDVSADRAGWTRYAPGFAYRRSCP
jgi:hypothetical protein